MAPTHDSLRCYYVGANWTCKVEHVGAKAAPDLNGPLIIRSGYRLGRQGFHQMLPPRHQVLLGDPRRSVVLQELTRVFDRGPLALPHAAHEPGLPPAPHMSAHKSVRRTCFGVFSGGRASLTTGAIDVPLNPHVVTQGDLVRCQRIPLPAMPRTAPAAPDAPAWRFGSIVERRHQAAASTLAFSQGQERCEAPSCRRPCAGLWERQTGHDICRSG